MKTIAKIVAPYLYDHPRLRNVPPSVIDDVVKYALEQASLFLLAPVEHPDELREPLFAKCEGEGSGVFDDGCRNFGVIDGAGWSMSVDDEGCPVHVCQACADEAKGEGGVF